MPMRMILFWLLLVFLLSSSSLLHDTDDHHRKQQKQQQQQQLVLVDAFSSIGRTRLRLVYQRKQQQYQTCSLTTRRTRKGNHHDRMMMMTGRTTASCLSSDITTTMFTTTTRRRRRIKSRTPSWTTSITMSKMSEMMMMLRMKNEDEEEEEEQEPPTQEGEDEDLVLSTTTSTLEATEEEQETDTTTQTTSTTKVRQQRKLTVNIDSDNISIDNLLSELRITKSAFDDEINDAITAKDTEIIRREYMSKKGPINTIMGYMKQLSKDDKPKLGSVINEIKTEMDKIIANRIQQLEIDEIQKQIELDKDFDVTVPGDMKMIDIGHRHPLSMTMEKAIDIFTTLGYDTVTSCADSPEIETDYYCFEALNCPKNHPARDMQDTFYLTEDMETLLRTHTSSVQIRQLEKRKPPLRIVAPGRVYRKDDIDATHSPTFHQVEILAIEKRGELHLGHLKGTVEYFLKNMFGPNIDIRFRGSYFPFTEPSMEVDVYFRNRWLEVLGCGMVDPNVLEMANLDPEEWVGFAAGFGVERFAMVIHNITDIREFYKSDRRFIEQFPHFYDDGMESFLQGADISIYEEEDIRGTTVPDPPVNSLEELIERRKQEEEEQAKKAKEEKKEKGEKKQKKKKDSGGGGGSSTEIDISKFDIRVGVITKAWEHEEADKLFCEEIDIGEEDGPRQIASGLRAYYNVDDLVGQRVLVLANLKARKLMGFPSHGMVLCSSIEDDEGNSNVQFVVPPDDAVIGERIIVNGYDDGEPATENQLIKKKMLDIIFPDLTTNDDGIATYKGVPLMTQNTKLMMKPSIPNGIIS